MQAFVVVLAVLVVRLAELEAEPPPPAADIWLGDCGEVLQRSRMRTGGDSRPTEIETGLDHMTSPDMWPRPADVWMLMGDGRHARRRLSLRPAPHLPVLSDGTPPAP